MMSSVTNFLHRHRRKFLYGGGFIASFFFLKRYAKHKLVEWHNRETQAIIKKQKRKQHYEKSRETAQAAVLSMAETLSKILKEELDSEGILFTLQQKPSNKQSLWEELKVLGFSQILCSIYLSSLAVAVINVKLMVLSGYSFSKNETDNSFSKTQHSIQQLYMQSIQEFMEKGIPLLIKKIYKVVLPCVEKLSLTQVVNIEQLEMILHDITLELAGEFTERKIKSSSKSRLRPWGQYIFEPLFLECNHVSQSVKELILETKDILDSEDFNSVMEGLIQQGLNLVLDYVSEAFPQPALNNNDGAQDNQLPEQKALQPNLFMKSTLPIAKLIPILSGSVHNLLSLGPGQLLQSMLLNSRLEFFSNNVYSAFCTEDNF